MDSSIYIGLEWILGVDGDSRLGDVVSDVGIAVRAPRRSPHFSFSLKEAVLLHTTSPGRRGQVP